MMIGMKTNGCSCCGEKPMIAVVQRTDMAGKRYKMMCRNDNCPARLETAAFATPEETVNAWNRESYK